MAYDDRELLEQTIDSIRNYNQDKRSPYSIEHFLLKLNDADQSQNKDLWEELREALGNSEQVNREATKELLTKTYFAEQGYWWWDPQNWHRRENE